MKLLVLTAIIAVVASNPVSEGKQWPWQVGQEYQYNVDSYTWTKFENSNSNGNAFKTQFIIRVLAPGRLVAKLENPLYAQVQGELSRDTLPSGLNYNPVQNIDHPFEILVDGGRVVTVKIPTSISVNHKNLLKGLVSAIQVDLSSFNHVDNFPNSYDKETFQGLFKKMETDVTGECETLYSVSPVSAEWHRELPVFAEDPIEITKSKNYGSCVNVVGYQFGLPDSDLLKGNDYNKDERQFIKHTSESRMLVGKQGTIYKSETFSSVFVNPLLFGKQKAEVYSYVSFYLSSVQPESNDEWKKSVEYQGVELLLFTLSSETFTKGKKNIADAQKLLQEMTPLLQDPNNLPKTDFLSKFNTLVGFIMFMDSEQLTQMTNSIEIAKSSKNIAKNNMWIVYRDAVAQAGTIDAFKEIKTWILTKKIEGDEASEVISSMASILHFRTKDIMTEFFDFAMSPEVQEQRSLNTTALLAVTKFISLGNENIFVEEKVIPRLSQELKQAIEKDDKHKAQVYVRVLGNLAHPSILKVFAPYLEGHITVTKYLRIQMVISLKTLANTKNPQIRAALFSLLKNTAEPYEIRVAAALNIFLAHPTHEMMQIMAHMTTTDPSTQVRAVLANGITFAAGLKDPRFALLAKAAKAVLPMVNKEKFGYRYSTDSLIDEYTSNDERAHFEEVSFIGSENHILPVYQRGALRFRNTGWTEEDWFTFSVSDMKHFMHHITGMYLQTPNESDDDFKYSAKNIAKILNIKPKHQCELEGSFFINNWDQQMLLTFDENDIYSFIMGYIKKMQQSVSGIETHYTKVLTHKQVFATFALATGMPFIFNYREPIAIILQSKTKAKSDKDMIASSNLDLQFTYARNLDGNVGFLDTLGDLYAASGVINKLQFYVPIKLNMTLKFEELKLNVEFPEQNANLVHMSVWPYTTLQKMGSLVTVSENPMTKFIERPAKVLSTDFKFGQLTGNVFQFQGYSYSSDYKNPSSLFNDDILTGVRNLLYQKDVALTQFNLKYLAKESQNKAVTYTLFYDTLYNQEPTSDEMEPASAINDVTPNSKARREEIVKRVTAGIESATVKLVDISAIFDGKQKKEYVFTGAFTNSFVDNKLQAALFFNGFEQINAVFKMTKPKIAPVNFEQAIKNPMKVMYEADFKFGNTDNVHFQGFGERSKKYTETLLKDPRAKQCLLDTSNHNMYQIDCHKMIIKAHAPDYFKGTVTYKNLTTDNLNMTYDTYELFKEVYPWEQQGDVLKIIGDGKVEIEAQAFYYDNYVNYDIKTKFGKLSLNNIEGMPYYPYAMAIYEPISSWERARNWFTDYQHLPFCSVDFTKIKTFSGRSYNYSLTSSWHVVMVDETKGVGNDLVILMKRSFGDQADVYVSYKTKTGKTLEMELTSKTYHISTNTEKVTDAIATIYYDDVAKAPLLEFYTIAADTEFYSINNGAVRFMYDNHRLFIFTDDHRSTTNGLCGQSTTQTSDDYMTPYGLVDLPEYYAASFSLVDEDSDPKTVELKEKAKLKAYQPVTKYTNILRSDVEWNKTKNESIKS